jgi:hypothetical protein
MSIHAFYVNNQRMVIAISYIMIFVSGLYIGRHSNHLQISQIEEYNYLTFKANTNQTLVPIPNEMSFHNLGMKYQTDKVTYHHYDPMYEKYVRKYVGTNITILEIGLGCGMSYGPGASAYLWRTYLGPLASIHFLEYDRGCGEDWYKNHGQKVKCYNKICKLVNELEINFQKLLIQRSTKLYSIFRIYSVYLILSTTYSRSVYDILTRYYESLTITLQKRRCFQK